MGKLFPMVSLKPVTKYQLRFINILQIVVVVADVQEIPVIYYGNKRIEFYTGIAKGAS